MFRNYLFTAIRNLRKNPRFFVINITGLAIGTLCCLYIVLFVEDQYGYDRQHREAGDIYRIDTRLGSAGGGVVNTGTASPPIAPGMKKDFAAVLQFTRVVPTSGFGVKEHVLRYGDKVFNEKDVVFADSTFFDLFNYHFIYGGPAGALAEPYSVVLLKPTSDKLFGATDPVGKVINIDNAYGKHDFKVTGVIDESLGKSQIHANVFMSMNSNGIGEFAYHTDEWAGENFAASFVRLRPGADVAVLEKQLPAFLGKYASAQLKAKGMTKTLYLEPMTKIHTNTQFDSGLGKTVDPSFLSVLLLIAALIQVIACINFMNQSTARASKRAREVGVRKVLGADRGDLLRQFLGESFLLALAGMLIALPLLALGLPYLNEITGADIDLTLLADRHVWLVYAGLIAVTGLLAGSYPAFYLSAFQAIKVIKGNFTSQLSAAGIRRVLVIFQFSLSILLVMGIVVIYSQLRYIANQDLGFDQQQKLVFSFHTDAAQARMNAFMNDLRQLPEVRAVGKATNYPSQHIVNDWPFFKPGGNVTSGLDCGLLFTDDQFRTSSGITLLHGRDFRTTDTDKVIINEMLARDLGYNPANATGQEIVPLHNPPMEIVGVMKDINYNSLHEEIKPLLLWYAPRGHSGWGAQLSDMVLNVRTANYSALLAKIGAIWHKDLPADPFEYTFLSEEVQRQYETEVTLLRIINSFALMAILISCLGLFGLAAFDAEQRTKEIGVRKVLGASVGGIVRLLSADFVKLVGIAFVLATPLAWWIMSEWLHRFVYRTAIQWWMPAAAGTLALAVALLTVSTQSLRAALSNPVKSLRSE
ncbi:MAG TPA: ABC transporter permease [Puia sp.]|jgi:putative ABC transport system permease protein|nr:ABC transporter permease [Puia sp.]